MLTYIFIGLALGSIYAMAAANLVITYESAGILNFALGSMAFFDAKFFFWAYDTHHWNLAVAGVVTLLGVAPVLGVTLYVTVFRYLRARSTLIKIVTSIGASVALPALAFMLFGNETINQAPGLAPAPVRHWSVLGATLTLDQVIIYGFLILMIGAGTFTLRFTDVGLRVRAMVDSEALTSLSGVNPNRVALGVWAVSGLLAGSCGVLAGPTIGVTVESMTLLMASSFAAVVAARLRSLGMAVATALLMGLVTDVLQHWLPQNSITTTNIVLCVPVMFILAFLLLHLWRGGEMGRETVRGGALDAAIQPEGGEVRDLRPQLESTRWGSAWYAPPKLAPLLPVALILFLPALTSGYWLGLIVRGIALAVVLLSFSLVTGDGGMLWLCQITFAGGGGLIAAELSSSHGVDPLLAGIAGALVMVPVGMLVGALTIKLGDLYVALVTLTLGHLVDTVVFSDQRFNPGMGGVTMLRPAFAAGDRAFGYFTLAIFLIIGLLTVNFRRSTAGLAMSAIRSSESATRSLGLHPIRIKLLLSGIAAFVAGLGGAMLTMYDNSMDPLGYNTFSGLVWLAVLATIGIRSLTAALVAGISYTLLPGVFSTYLPTTWLQVPALLFGLGAIGLAMHPEGVVAQHGRALNDLLFNRRSSARSRQRDSTPASGQPKPAAAAHMPETPTHNVDQKGMLR